MGNKKDEFGNRMKLYEGYETSQRFIPLLPVIIRLEGKCFSKFTKGLEKPYDKRFSDMMRNLTKDLVKETNACVGYTQSDEITLVLNSDNIESQIYFDGKKFKIISVISAFASSLFNRMIPIYLPEKSNKPIQVFDCSAWNVPNKIEAVNSILWREKDATKNSISSAAQFLYKHKELLGKSSNEMQEMIFQKGINWNDYPDFFNRNATISESGE